jgi:dynein heavy chain
MAERWANYIKKIDGLAEYGIISASRNTLIGIYELLNGRNNMKPDPIIAVEIKLNDRNIDFEPELQQVVNTIKHIYFDLTKSIKIFPRLVEKFELPNRNDSQDFYELVNDDIECREAYFQINSVIEQFLEKVNDYIETWLLFRIVWEIDIDKFMQKYEERGLDLVEFENSMMKYYDVSNQVLMQDTSVVISFVTFDCTKLKKSVLEYIEAWKKGYKQTLCMTMIKKLEIFNEKLTSRVKLLSEQPTNAAELDTLVKLHDQSTMEYREREEEMDEIRKYHKYLGKKKCYFKIFNMMKFYNFFPPSSPKKNTKSLPHQLLTQILKICLKVGAGIVDVYEILMTSCITLRSSLKRQFNCNK